MRRRGLRFERYCAIALVACAAAVSTVSLACGRAETAPRASAAAPAPEDPRPVVLFLGDSLAAGHGLSAEQAFPARVQERIDAAGLDYRVVNAGVSGDTSAGGLRRIDWLLRLPLAAVVIELGGNDMLRGHSPDALRSNLREIIDRVRDAHPGAGIVLAGMRAVPNLGPRYVEAFEAVYPEVAREEGAALIPFLLEGVAGRPALNQADGIHPTAEGHEIVAETVWATLKPVLQSMRPPA